MVAYGAFYIATFAVSVKRNKLTHELLAAYAERNADRSILHFGIKRYRFLRDISKSIQSMPEPEKSRWLKWKQMSQLRNAMIVLAIGFPFLAYRLF